MKSVQAFSTSEHKKKKNIVVKAALFKGIYLDHYFQHFLNKFHFEMHRVGQQVCGSVVPCILNC